MWNPDARPLSGGWLLPPGVRAQMEALFDAQLSDVCVQVSPQPLAVGALAYAQGNSICFAPGCFDPASHRGRALLAHELAHVLQQRSGKVALPDHGLMVVDDARLEGEAEIMAARAARLPAPAHQDPEVWVHRPPCPAPIQRQVIWVPKKSAEYGFLADVDQLEVDETADTLVLRGHGPKLSLTEAFQLAMGN